MKRIGKLLGIVLMLLLGGLLIYLAFDPPEFLIFRQGVGTRIGSGLVGAFLVLAGIMNVFRRDA